MKLVSHRLSSYPVTDPATNPTTHRSVTPATNICLTLAISGTHAIKGRIQ